MNNKNDVKGIDIGLLKYYINRGNVSYESLISSTKISKNALLNVLLGDAEGKLGGQNIQKLVTVLGIPPRDASKIFFGK